MLGQISLPEFLERNNLPKQLFRLEAFDALLPTETYKTDGLTITHYDGYTIISGDKPIHFTMLCNFCNLYFEVKNEGHDYDGLPFVDIYCNDKLVRTLTDEVVCDMIKDGGIKLIWEKNIDDLPDLPKRYLYNLIPD